VGDRNPAAHLEPCSILDLARKRSSSNLHARAHAGDAQLEPGEHPERSQKVAKIAKFSKIAKFLTATQQH
jgi:hypothetical protein